MAQKRTAQLDARLQMTASLVRPHAVFADVGCDHGHLAIELMRQGAVRGYACDINPGPLESARRNILHAGLEGCVETVLTDGLEGMEARGITDVTIAGNSAHSSAAIPGTHLADLSCRKRISRFL